MQLLHTFLLFWLLLSPFPASDFDINQDTGNRIALHIDSDGAFFPDGEQLSTARSLGIDLIEISDPSRLDEFTLRNFYILLSSGNKYTTLHELTSNRNELIGRTENNYRNQSARVRDRIAAVSILKYPADYTERSVQAISSIADSLAQRINKPLYYQSGHTQIHTFPENLSFASVIYYVDLNSGELQSPVVYFEPSGFNHRKSVEQLELVLNNSHEYPGSITILPAQWFFETLEKQPDLAILFSSYIDGDHITLPLPAESGPPMDPNWHVILLFIIFGAWLIHYKYQPFFLSLFLRYYFNHRFFVADIFENRVRNKSSAITILVLHSLSAGLFFYLMSGFLFSSNGFSALSYHFPVLFFEGFEQFIFLALGIITALLSHCISILWIYFLNKNITQFGQVFNLYSWPLLINILLAGLLVILLETGTGSFVIYSLSILFLLVWFFSFNIAAISSSRFLDKNPYMNLVFTIGIHSVLLIALIITFLFTPEIIEPFLLAYRLP